MSRSQRSTSDAYAYAHSMRGLPLLRRRPTVPFILASVAVSLFVLSYFFTSSTSVFGPPPPRVFNPVYTGTFDNTWNYTRDAKNLKLDDEQCGVAFPNLFQEIDRAANLRSKDHVTLRDLDDVPQHGGFLRGMIYDQELFIIGATDGVNSRNLATLSALHRAILTSPHPLPNIEFTMHVQDLAPDNAATWTYCRTGTSLASKNWLMPDFGYYSWPEPHIGAYNEIQYHTTEVDRNTPWAKKIPELIWRGAILERKVREDLIHESANKTWSAVRELVWAKDDKGETHDRLTMWDHCRYKYVAHTEGVSYSSRLQNLQNCRSVIVAHQMSFVQHHSHLMQKSGDGQNYVEVKEDWTDLDATMQALIERDGTEEGRKANEAIAENNIKTFKERYITPAAETCYWRRLIRRWAEVSPEPEFFKKGEKGEHGDKVWRGIPVENYLLERRMDWPLG